jgi:hypothetical protein
MMRIKEFYISLPKRINVQSIFRAAEKKTIAVLILTEGRDL